MVQWVNNPTAVAQVAAEAWIRSLAGYSVKAYTTAAAAAQIESLARDFSICHGRGHLKKIK